MGLDFGEFGVDILAVGFVIGFPRVGKQGFAREGMQGLTTGNGLGAMG